MELRSIALGLLAAIIAGVILVALRILHTPTVAPSRAEPLRGADVPNHPLDALPRAFGKNRDIPRRFSSTRDRSRHDVE
jgi:hypothetical protein